MRSIVKSPKSKDMLLTNKQQQDNLRYAKLKMRNDKQNKLRLPLKERRNVLVTAVVWKRWMV